MTHYYAGIVQCVLPSSLFGQYQLCVLKTLCSASTQVWRRAFGEWNIPRAPADTDDFHIMVRSKVYRAKLWLSHPGTSWKSLVFSLCTGPVDHLMQELQLVDAQGNGYRDLASSKSNLFIACGRSMAALLLDDSPEAMLLTSCFEVEGPEIVALVMEHALATLLSLAGRVWRQLDTFHQGWPYKLLGLVSPHTNQAQREAIAEELCSAEPCCLDDHISKKVCRTINNNSVVGDRMFECFWLVIDVSNDRQRTPSPTKVVQWPLTDPSTTD